ncbi:MAG TPA: LytTR family DNA-binding domain-containing protein [Vicinamibacterales bacterium]|nr:LytTR family DNA-binding domain-containing protein [Vicinamibacterales bacterium]
MSLRTLIADDEPVARRRIRRLLRSTPDVVIVGETGDGRATVDAIHAQAPDLVFLDVQMPELDGVAVVEAVRHRPPAIVFVTAFDSYALRAFDVRAVDYLVKPFSEERFLDALSRVRAQLVRKDDLEALTALLTAAATNQRYLTRIPVRAGERIRIVDVGDIDFILAADNYVTLMTGGREHLVRETLEGLLRELDPRRFLRVHRSAIVQIDRIRELMPVGGGDYAVTLRDGTRLTLSRTFRERVLRALGRPR